MVAVVTRIASTSLWQEPSAVAVAATAQRVYPSLHADGHWFLSGTPADQDATMATKAGRLFLDLGVTDGGVIVVLGSREVVALVNLPASTT